MSESLDFCDLETTTPAVPDENPNPSHKAIKMSLIRELNLFIDNHLPSEDPHMISTNEIREELVTIIQRHTILPAGTASIEEEFDRVSKNPTLIQELAMLIRQLSHSLKKANSKSTLPERAINYLRRHSLLGSPLR